MTCNSDLVCVCGDLNARIGNKVDFIEGVDVIKPRISIDSVINNHGKWNHVSPTDKTNVQSDKNSTKERGMNFYKKVNCHFLMVELTVKKMISHVLVIRGNQ